MSVGLEIIPAERWLYGTLSSDAGLTALIGDRVYAYQAPQGSQMPYLVITYISGTDLRIIGGVRVWASLLYQAKVIGQGRSAEPIAAVATAMNAALENASGSVVDGTVLFCSRQFPISYVEEANGTLYRHLGALYRLGVQGV